MRFLRILFIAVLQRRFRQVFITKILANIAAHHFHGVLTQVSGVRTHIGNMTGFVKTLGHHHGFLHTEAQTRTGRLLQCGSNERRTRLAAGRFVFTIHHGVTRFFKQRNGRVSLFFIDRFERFFEMMRDFHLQRGFFLRQQIRMQFPVFFRHERFDFFLTLDDQTHRNGLNTTCG
ncbi:hypothetical protein SRABI106_04002 [Rahnella aquatilis]|nr:hypothetical protein SRABI106_04002 [Rahnella aquatilis]